MTTDGRGARGASPASDQIMRFLDAFAPGESIAALCIPHKGTSTEQQGCSRGQGSPRIGFCGFLRRNAPNKASAALRIPHKGTSTEQRECPRCKARLELDSAVFSGAMCRTKLLPHSVFRTREHPQSMRFFRRFAPEKPPRSRWLRGGPAVTGMGDATRT